MEWCRRRFRRLGCEDLAKGRERSQRRQSLAGRTRGTYWPGRAGSAIHSRTASVRSPPLYPRTKLLRPVHPPSFCILSHPINSHDPALNSPGALLRLLHRVADTPPVLSIQASAEVDSLGRGYLAFKFVIHLEDEISAGLGRDERPVLHALGDWEVACRGGSTSQVGLGGELHVLESSNDGVEGYEPLGMGDEESGRRAMSQSVVRLPRARAAALLGQSIRRTMADFQR